MAINLYGINMITRHVNIPASYLTLLKDNKILLLRRFNTGYEDGKYSMIAGHVEEVETFTQGKSGYIFYCR